LYIQEYGQEAPDKAKTWTSLTAVFPVSVVRADARPTALLAPASYAVVLEDARPAALLAPASSAVVLATSQFYPYKIASATELYE